MYRESHADVDAGATGRSTPWLTRRAVLAAGGVVALGSLAGCTALDGLVNRASEEAVANRAASPAGFYRGVPNGIFGVGEVKGVTTHRSSPVDVRFVPPTLRADSQRIEIDGWSTSTTTKAQGYNSSRSNKPRSVWVPDPLDDDDDGDGVPELVAVLDIERALLVYADAAIAAVDERASDDATATLDAFINATTKVRAELEGCQSETCVSVSEHADARMGLAQDARDAVDAGEWDSARRSIQQARRIVQEDIERVNDKLYDAEDLAGQNPLYDYLAGEPTITEHFAVSLPDARVRGGGPSLADEITPKRVLEYFLGERNAERCGENDRAVAVHRDLSCRDLLTARLEERKKKIRHVAAFETSGGVVVTGATPDAADAAPMLWIAPDNTVSSDVSLDSWGGDPLSKDVGVSSALVCPVDATPADCPCPMPALFHVRRIRHEDQLLFVGGWTIDDGALYENSATLLTADGPNFVAGVRRSDIEEGGVGFKQHNDRRVRKKPGRTTYANITLGTPYDPDAEHLPAGAHPVCRDDGEVWCWGVQSREALARHETGGCPGKDGDAPAWSVATALDAPVLHLVGAADASNDVKFKAGAELSKAVN